jgi:hypothetical protein
MRSLYFIMLLIAALSHAVLAAEPPGRVDTFSKLKQGDTLIVRFHTSGCFHDETYEFTFRRASELTVSVAQLPRSAAYAGLVAIQTNRVDLGTLTLSKPDLARLDKLMEFYRSKHRGVCTTIDHITFTQQRGGRTLAIEEITDASCQSHGMKRLTRFSDLIDRLTSPMQ